MAWTETWDEAQIRMLGEMAAVSRQFEAHYGVDVVAAILTQAKEQGHIPSDPEAFGVLFEGVEPSSKVVSLDEERARRSAGSNKTPDVEPQNMAAELG